MITRTIIHMYEFEYTCIQMYDCDVYYDSHECVFKYMYILISHNVCARYIHMFTHTSMLAGAYKKIHVLVYIFIHLICNNHMFTHTCMLAVAYTKIHIFIHIIIYLTCNNICHRHTKTNTNPKNKRSSSVLFCAKNNT